MKGPVKGQQIELWIDRLSTGGRGVGRHEGLVVFVSDTAPNERVLVEITLKKKSFAEAKLIRVLEASPTRITPPCPVAGICGGCSWQHVDYKEQLNQKRGLVADAMRKFAGRGEVAVEPVVPSPKEFNYRNRIQLHYDKGLIGFFRRGSHRIIDIDHCPITENELNREITPLRERLKKSKSDSCRIELYRTPSGKIVQTDEPRFDDELGFSQVNEGQNAQMIDNVIDRIDPRSSIVLDLYAGAGNFSFPVRERLNKPVVAVELHPKSVQQGRERAASSSDGRPSIKFHESDVETFLKQLASGHIEGLSFQDIKNSTVILDPPRAGCSPEVISLLLSLRPMKVVYVSCHPVTLARDIAGFDPGLFTLRDIRPFDMFPQTDHVETVVTLDRI